MASASLRAVPPLPPTPVESAFRAYAGYVAAVATRMLGSDDEVQDVVQETFLSALRGLERLREPQAARGWLATVTVRIATRRLRLRRFRSFFGLEAAREYHQLVDPSASPEQRLLLCRVYDRLDTLPVSERVAWLLRYVEGEPLDSVARICRCSLATAKRRISAAHGALKKEVDGG